MAVEPEYASVIWVMCQKMKIDKETSGDLKIETKHCRRVKNKNPTYKQGALRTTSRQ